MNIIKMKIVKHSTSMVSDIVNHMKKNGLSPKAGEELYSVLEDNILMNIIISGQLYEVPYVYWKTYIVCYSNCVGHCNDDTLNDLEQAKEKLLQNATKLREHALVF